MRYAVQVMPWTVPVAPVVIAAARYLKAWHRSSSAQRRIAGPFIIFGALAAIALLSAAGRGGGR